MMHSAPSRCFPPAVTPNVRVLILGSLPGERSLAQQQYYAHPRNQFWRLAGELAGADLPLLEYEARLSRLNACGIGLWDVVAAATRPGSLDQHLRDIVPNRLADLVAALPELRAIAFNGSTASRIGRKEIGNDPGDRLTLIDLPSSSPANTVSYATKAEAWCRLAPWMTG